MHDAFEVTQSDALRLVIMMPGWSMLFGWIGFVLSLILIIVVFTTSRTVRRVIAYDKSPEQVNAYVLRYRIQGMSGSAAILILFALLFYSSGSIVLDRRTGMASMSTKMTAFLPEQTVSTPLRDIESAWLDATPNARRIRLTARSGHDLGFSLWSDRPGQQEAVYAINRFLHRE